MAINNIPSNLSNLIAPFLPAGQRPVGQETAENRNSTFKPVEQSAKMAESHVQLDYQQHGEEQEARENAKQQHEAEGDGDEAEEPALQGPSSDSPRSRLARRFSGSTGACSRTGRNFDELA